MQSKATISDVCVDSAALQDRVKGSLFGLLIADALAMPTHWFYGGESQVRSTYGVLTGYVAPVTRLPGSIMSKSNTGGAGRGSFKGDVIGGVIFHDKKDFWKPGADYHYHQGMAAGDNTLEALLARRLINVTGSREGIWDGDALIQDYISFMTTPKTHNDTYCGTSHRMFFANYASGAPPPECPDNDRHNVDSADALVTTIPAALIASDDSAARDQAANTVLLTRHSPDSAKYARVLSDALRSVVRGTPLREALEMAGKEVGYDVAGGAKGQAGDPVTA